MNLLRSVVAEQEEQIKANEWSVRIEKMPVNSGLPAVRQHGVTLASANYVAHVDSDDWVEPDFLECLYNETRKKECDIVFCDSFKDDGYVREVCQRFDTFDGYALHLMRRMMLTSELGNVWGALYRRELFRPPYTPPTCNMGEDLATNIQVLYLCVHPVSWVRRPLYHYFYNSESISRCENESNMLKNFHSLHGNVDVLDAFFLRLGLSSEYSNELASLRLWACRPLTPLLLSRKYYRLWRTHTDAIDVKIVFNFSLPISVRVHYMLSWLRIAPILSKIKHSRKR